MITETQIGNIEKEIKLIDSEITQQEKAIEYFTSSNQPENIEGAKEIIKRLEEKRTNLKQILLTNLRKDTPSTTLV